MAMDESTYPTYGSWEPVLEAFFEWIKGRDAIFEPGLAPEPTIKVLTFLALLESNKACTYEDIREIFRKKTVIKGNVPDNTLRTSVLNLGKTLEKFNHPLELKSLRGRFQLIARQNRPESASNLKKVNVLILDDPIINETEIAKTFVEKSMMPFNALYFLEWSARFWEIYSRHEAEIRVPYEAYALERLGIKENLFKHQDINTPLCMVGLGPSEGLPEIEILKRLFSVSEHKKIHYLAVDSSPRLLRNHIGLLKEALAEYVENGRLIAAGVVADIFINLRETIRKVRNEFKTCGTIQSEHDFLPSSASMLVTYFGNCLGNEGNNIQDPEVGFFSMLHSVFPNRPLEILVGVSVMRNIADEYKRNWDDFLLCTPKHFLDSKLFESSRKKSDELAEFTLKDLQGSDTRCPPVIPEPYLARHQIEGQIYRFYYRLAFDLKLNHYLSHDSRQLPKGALILLYNIIKYNMRSLVSGIEKIGLFQVKYDPEYHQLVQTANGEREYAVFSAYIEE